MTKEQRASYMRRWRKENKVALRRYYLRYRKNFPGKLADSLRTSSQKRKKEAIDHYGKLCQCCGEDRLVFLCLDHIAGGGNRHRKKIGAGIVLWLRRNNYPKGFQVLCHNCNFAKSQGVCPHKMESTQ